MNKARALRYHIDQAEKHLEHLEKLKHTRPHKIETLNELTNYWENKIKEWKTSIMRLAP